MNIEKIREDFPVLKKKIIYFDNSCMSLRPIQVIEAMNLYYKEFPSCGGRSIHSLGKKVTDAYAKARETVAKFINAKPEEIIFTKNTTESINLIAHSLHFEKNDTILTTDKEHNSNLLPWQLLSEKGINHIVVKSNEDNTFSMENFQQSFKNNNVKLVSFAHTSNLDGYTIPAKEIIKTAHDNGSFVLLDSAQYIPHHEIDVKNLDVDFLAFSGHKMLGPSIGCLYIKKDVAENLKPFIVGGETVSNSTYSTHEFLPMPEKFEAGLQNYAGAIGLEAAILYLKNVGIKNIEKHESELNKNLTKGLEMIDEIKIIGPDVSKRSGITSFFVKEMDSHSIALMLDEMAKIMVRSGQHCVHSWFNAHQIKSSVRVSFYLYNTQEEVEQFLETLQKIIQLKK